MTQILKLSVKQRIRLAQDLWDSVAETDEALAVTPAENRLMRQRLAAFRKNPQAIIPWAEIKKRLQGRPESQQPKR